MTKCLDATIKVYREAVSYLINISLIHYEEIREMSTNAAMSAIECLVHSTSKRQAKYPKFDKLFYKMPSYLRRNAIVTANAKVDSYRKLYAQWQENGCKGKAPRLNRTQSVMPCFYRDNMFVQTGEYTAKIKVYHRNDWVWQAITLRKSDVDYISKNCFGYAESAPVLVKRNHGYELRFAYRTPNSEKRFVKDIEVKRVIGVDLGINTDAVCSSVTADGTVMGCRFIDHPVEKDRLYTTLGRIRKCQANGNRHPRRLWRFVDNYSRAVVIKTVVEIIRYAKEQNADVIVFEDLTSLRGKARGVNKQKIALWRKKEIQHRAEEMAARSGIRCIYIKAGGTSQYAFDGSGKVLRGTDGGFNTNSLCRFASGKEYNCDLSASKNIAARYLLLCKQKSMTETSWLHARAKVPELCTRTKSNLATLTSLVAEAV